MNTLREAATFQALSDPITVSKLAQTFNVSRPISLLDLLKLANARSMVDSMTQLLSSGSPGTKINIAIIGDGFAAGDDQTIYNNIIKELVVDGLFKEDFFLEEKSAFNIYRVNLISQDSGVGTKTYQTDPITGKCPRNSKLINTVTKNTALGIYYSGCWGHCWTEDGPNSGTLIDNALNKWVPDHTFTLVLLNNSGSGGCGGGGRATLPTGVAWHTIAHEIGHGLGGLGDEYCGDGTYTGPEPSCVNNTINTDKNTLKWKSYIDAATPIPTGIGKCSNYNQGSKPGWWDDDQSVGLFEGAGSDWNKGIYRPVINCRMNGNKPPYCPVCYAQMKSIAEPHKSMPTREEAGKENKDESIGTSPPAEYVRFKIHVDSGKLSVTDIKSIQGPLIVSTAIIPGHVFEVLVRDESIIRGSLPDVGVRRSFANIDVPAPENRHHITILPNFDFFVRVPKNYVTREALPQFTIKLHKVQETPDQLTRAVPLIKHSGVLSTEIGHLDGIRLDELPELARPRLERILRENAK